PDARRPSRHRRSRAGGWRGGLSSSQATAPSSRARPGSRARSRSAWCWRFRPSAQYVARFAAKRNQSRQQISAALIHTLARKADKSACVAYFPVDSRNENLPEKCIHQNCATGPGGTPRGIFVARTPRAFRSDENKVSRTGPYRSDLMQPMDAVNRGRLQDSCFGVVLCNKYRNFNVSGSNGTRTHGRSPAHGADSYGASRTWRQAAGRSAIFGPGLGFAGGPGLGWSTASVNQYASSWPQPSSAGRARWGLHSALSDGQTSRTWK